jgi:hypothetical protein
VAPEADTNIELLRGWKEEGNKKGKKERETKK